MSNANLILLGFLAERPMSAYDIHKQVQFRNLSHWVKLGKATIFKNVGVLEQKGYLSGTTQREGKLPEKTVYSLTAEGREYFLELMQAAAYENIPLLFDFNTVIGNLTKIPPQKAIEYIQAIKSTLSAKRDFIAGYVPQRQHVQGTGRAIMRQQRLVLDARLAWANEVEQDCINDLEE